MIATIELHDELLARALELACLGGLRWVRTITFCDGGEPRFFAPLRGGKWVVVEEATGHGHALTGETIKRGIRVIAESYPTVLLPLLGHVREVSATDGDILLQCALFGSWQHRVRDSERPTLRHEDLYPESE